MNKNSDYYYYKKRFEKYADKKSRRATRIKTKLLSSIYNNRFAKKLLNESDSYYFFKNSKETLLVDNLYLEDFRLNKNVVDLYTEITLNKIDYLEVIEIDNFDMFRKSVLSKFAHHNDLRGVKQRDDIKQNLFKVKSDLDTISKGGLFSINYSKKQNEKNDLISYVNVSYIKTNESYFILRFSVTPSQKFKDIFRKIIESANSDLSERHYNSTINILKTRIFNSHETFSNLKTKNIKALLSDLNYQIRRNITKYFKGYFHSIDNYYYLPSIEYFEIENMQKFKNDKFWDNFIYNGFYGYYSLEDKEINIYLQNPSKEDSNLIQVVKQKGHGLKENKENDLTDYDNIETYYLMRSLAFPCVFQGILKQEFARLNLIKREIYDFVTDISKWNILKIFLLFYYNKRYIKLKTALTKVLLTTKRFESEFTKQNMQWLTHDFQLDCFHPVNNQIDKEKKNLLTQLIENFGNQIKKLDLKTKSTNEIFKTIEELNGYRTNFIIQITSLLIAVLAFVFTFEKVKDFFIWLLKL